MLMIALCIKLTTADIAHHVQFYVSIKEYWLTGMHPKLMRKDKKRRKSLERPSFSQILPMHAQLEACGSFTIHVCKDRKESGGGSEIGKPPFHTHARRHTRVAEMRQGGETMGEEKKKEMNKDIISGQATKEKVTVM